MPVLAVGTGKLKIDGVLYAVADEMRIMAATEKREALVGLDGSVTMQVEFVSPWVEASLRDSPDVDLSAVFLQKDVTVQVELQNGSSYALGGAFYTGDGELDVKDGKVSARWNGQTLTRIV